ncbi:MAG TPA: glycosyltransferase [Actinopolymorphaceae bacterium]
MRIAMVSEHASPLAALGGADAGGQNVHVAALAEALAGLGHEVVVYTRREDPEQRYQVPLCDGVTVVHVRAGPPRPMAKDSLLPYMREMGEYLAAHWRGDPPDVVHTHFWMSALAALTGRHGCPSADFPIVHTYHALGSVKRRFQGPKDTSPPARIEIERSIGRQVDHIIATCSDEARELAALGIPASKVTVVPCGVDTARFTPHGPVAERTSDRARLLAIGRLVERKGFDTAIAAIRAIPHAELLIAGGPPRERLHDDPEARRLLDVARRHWVSDRVHLLGSVERPEMPALIRSADLVVCTPWYEPFGIVPLEAAACGRPIVGSAVGGLLDTVVEGTTGILLPPRRPRVLARVTCELLTEAPRREVYGRAARARVLERYAWPRIAEQTLAAYRSVLSREVVTSP